MADAGLVVITGSTSGIGKAVASAFLAQGANVVINGRKSEAVQAVVDDLNATGSGKAIGVAGDVSTADGAAEFIENVDALGVIDVLVNNVGVFEVRDFFGISDDEWKAIIETNFFSTLRLSRHYLQSMLSRRKGRIINVSSEAGVRIIPDMMHYSVTKQMQIGLSHGLAQLARGSGVTVNTVLPGPTWTEGVQTYIEGLAVHTGVTVEEATLSYFKEREPTSLLQRFIKPEEVASLVVYLASDGAAAINGAAIRVEGGMIRSATG